MPLESRGRFHLEVGGGATGREGQVPLGERDRCRWEGGIGATGRGRQMLTLLPRETHQLLSTRENHINSSTHGNHTNSSLLVGTTPTPLYSWEPHQLLHPWGPHQLLYNGPGGLSYRQVNNPPHLKGCERPRWRGWTWIRIDSGKIKSIPFGSLPHTPTPKHVGL